MSKVFVDIGMSLDGYIAGPNGGPDNTLGDGGPRIHRWAFQAEAWRERQSLVGGQRNRDNEVVAEAFSRTGAYVMGRRMFDEGEHNWPDPPPFNAPVFVLTHHPRDPWPREGGTTFYFVADDIESALRQAREAAGKKDVRISGGAHTVRQYLNAGLVDDLDIHLAPIVMGEGVPLFDLVDTNRLVFQPREVINSDQVTHLRYRVALNDR